MRKGVTLSHEWLIKFAAGIIIGLAILILVIIPVYMRVRYGECWASMDRTVSDIKSDLTNLGIDKSTVRKVPMGDCAGGMIIFNKGSNPGGGAFSGVIDEVCPCTTKEKCPNFEGYKSYILVIPWKTVQEELDKDKSFWSKAWETITLQNIFGKGYKYLTDPRLKFLKPMCTGLEHEFDKEYYIPQGFETKISNFNQKDTAFCFSLEKRTSTNKDGYQYRLLSFVEIAPDGQCIPGSGG